MQPTLPYLTLAKLSRRYLNMSSGNSEGNGLQTSVDNLQVYDAS